MDEDQLQERYPASYGSELSQEQSVRIGILK